MRRLNLNEEQIKSLPETDLLEKILSEFIGKKVMSLEFEKLGITVNDQSLSEIIKNDTLFKKDNKFSRTEYEKFLIKSGITAPQFESNIVEQEKKRQFLSSLSGGIIIPNSLIKKEFNKENQIKTKKYIDLEKFHLNKKPTNKEIKDLYERNKSVFVTEFRSLRYAELNPEILISKRIMRNFLRNRYY